MPELYTERLPRELLRDRIACVWTGRASGDVRGVLPDGCIDIVWSPGRGLRVAGPDTASRPAAVPAGTTLIGVRFMPGVAAPILGAPISSLTDLEIPLSDVWPRNPVNRLQGCLDEARSPAESVCALEDAIAERLCAAPDPDPMARVMIAAITRIVAIGTESCSFPAISERQLRRRFRASVGYGPKTFERVARFRHFLRLANAAPNEGGSARSLARIAAAAGYADQSHLNRECMRFAGRTPGQIVRELQPMSDLFKTLDFHTATIAP
ncbi:MAG TPA: DUF6597 domain-containing transcriptional factor [Candidatus Binataceae bacterium]